MDPAVPSSPPWGSPSCPFPEGSIPALLPRTAWGQTSVAREGHQGARRRRPTPESIPILVFTPIFFWQGHRQALCVPLSDEPPQSLAALAGPASRANTSLVVATSQATCSGLSLLPGRFLSQPWLCSTLLFSFHSTLFAFCSYVVPARALPRWGPGAEGGRGRASSEPRPRTALSWREATASSEKGFSESSSRWQLQK